ncbi:transcription-repair coupling factor [Aureliella helgolandensis]|uniref:Transcription-repair-coupling factor n=1 Tax=Aureliella helgolandensis TaxID=2527968 RepID=A0A518FZW4_9BACT|nr:transcription-repair coupling factor [Aureliella helgolandensis]QDV21804.1 Transcription-repair-coupling factor [Aureliella helgolandensis]
MAERRAILKVKRGQQREALSLPLAIAQLAQQSDVVSYIDSVRQEGRGTIEGVWPGALAPLIASWLCVEPRPLLIILPQLAEAEALAAEVGELQPLEADVFPPGSEETELESLAHQETAQRLHVLSRLYKYAEAGSKRAAGRISPPIVVTTLPALMHSVPSPASLEGDKHVLQAGRRVDVEALRRWLVEAGYHATSSVQLPGEFATRGGILDIFPPDEALPVRVELFDDEVESLRSFDVISQRSIERRETLQLLAVQGSVAQDGNLLDYMPSDTIVMVHESLTVNAAAEAFLSRVPFPERFDAPQVLWQRLASYTMSYSCQLAAEGYLGQLGRLPLNNVERIGGDLEKLGKEIDEHCQQRSVIVVAMNDGEQQRLGELLSESQALKSGRLEIVVSQLQNGFEIIPDGMWVLTAGQLLRRSHVRRAAKRTKSKPIDSFLDLRSGDLIVHLSHGIGVYRGTELLEKHGQKFEHLVLEFDGGTRIFVPSSKIELVQRYVGGTKSKPKLAKIGGQAWARQKKAAESAVQDMAVELLELQAQRNSQPGIVFGADSVWQNQFDASFSYVETPDQLTAIDAVKGDMHRSRPMDRLICGDVGFGKTEVAMRAAFKAVDSGYQVAVLVPTTVLAEQHFKSFRERLAEFPFDIEKLSRFASARQQKETVRGIISGRVDIVIGTHRIASKDLKFYNLGLLIIDEEQRFGVEIKERLKHLRSNVDVLTLSATPIPRTLHMSLVGVRDISNLETPPADRLAVETRTVRFDDSIIRNAVLRELNRGGQIYFVHNRVHDIEELAARLKRIVPEASIVVGHGQMAEGQLEQVMIDFIEHRYDILLATTIIESGLDIPNANTIFIDEANRYGLAELHQLRGRVGRYKHQAHCYLLVDRHKHLSPDAARRLHAIEEYSQIGAGFGIAMRDLEIRGAGNLLGTQQSGHIAAVGYELYCQLLGNAVRELTHQPPKLAVDVDIDIPVQAFLPIDYVPELRHRIDIYRRLSRVSDIKDLDEMSDELNDRFGRLPQPVQTLLQVAELKIDAAIWFVKSLQVEEQYLVMTYTNRQRIEHLAKLHDRRLRIVDSQKAYWVTDTGRAGEPIDWIAQARQALRSA